MGGGKRRQMNKSTSRKHVPQSLFVEGGVLGGLDTPRSSAQNRGKKVKKPPTVRSGNSANGSGSNSNSNSKKSSANSFRYEYPSVELKDIRQSEPSSGTYNEEGSSKGSRPVILLGSKDSKIVAFEDSTPSMGPSKVEYHYEYSSGFSLGESSHRGLGFSDEPDETPAVTELPEDDNKEMVEEEEEEEDDEQLHRGLGFPDEPESAPFGAVLSSTSVQEREESSDDFSPHEIVEDDDDDDEGSMDEDEDEDADDNGSELAHEFSVKTPSRVKNSAYVSIGGVRLYTEDISDDDNEDEDEDEEYSSDDGSTSESSESDDSEDCLDFETDIDDDVMEDYLEGIGGSSQILKSKWLASQNIDGYGKGNDDSSSDEYGKTLKKLSGVALQEASREYGVQKQKSKKNPPAKSKKSKSPEVAWSSALDDLMLVKDPRRRPAKAKHVAQFSQSWPSKGGKSKKYGRFPGEKKKHRKESIAAKRRERMLRRGADLEQINLKLKQMVLGNMDILSFPPMHTRDCSQVQRLAAIYRLRSGCLGSGKKRFVTVSRTQHTSMPSASDEIRLEKLIGSNKDDADFPVVNTPLSARNGSAQSKSTTNTAIHQGSSSRSGKKRSDTKAVSYNQPLSFVPSGIIQSEVVQVSNVVPNENNQEVKAIGDSSLSIGSFEVHTKGFGSKMMAKMGYVEGEGLGKDGKGMSQPIEVIQRPKSLGLGMSFVENSSETVNMGKNSGGSARKYNANTGGFQKHTKGSVENSNKTPVTAKRSGGSAKKSTPNIGAFEKHTKGFGSKMMARMGFVDGMGLGRDSQGIVTPLTAVRRPKARGLGAEDKG